MRDRPRGQGSVGDAVDELIGCPRCYGIASGQDGVWVCARCGQIGRNALGFADFVGHERFLSMAAGARMDLEADEEAARELDAASTDVDFDQLRALADEIRFRQQDRSSWSPRRRTTVERFEKQIDRVNAEGTATGGDALLAKVDRKLEELGWPPLLPGAALEAGGGHGFYLPALSARFETVVFVDASLVNVVLAAKLAKERGLSNVVCVRADVTALPFAAETFEFVHQNGVVEHVADPVAMAREGVRVRRSSGYYLCVSPNRMSLAREPHCGLPAYGFIPDRLRQRLMPLRRGLSWEESATDPRSLPQLRRYLDDDDQDVVVFFLPRKVPFTARQTPARRLVRRSLDIPVAGAMLDRLLNVVLLPVVPQHIAIVRARRQSS